LRAWPAPSAPSPLRSLEKLAEHGAQYAQWALIFQAFRGGFCGSVLSPPSPSRRLTAVVGPPFKPSRFCHQPSDRCL
jgi:hypothetical protein